MNKAGSASRTAHHVTGSAADFACVLNLSMLFVVRSLGAVGTTVVAQTKAALTVFGSVALFNEVVSPVEFVGFVAVLGGAYLYNRVEKEEKGSAVGGHAAHL